MEEWEAKRRTKFKFIARLARTLLLLILIEILAAVMMMVIMVAVEVIPMILWEYW